LSGHGCDTVCPDNVTFHFLPWSSVLVSHDGASRFSGKYKPKMAFST